MIGYPLAQLHQEVAYIAYYFHWQPETILNLEHRIRRRWVKEIADINQKLNQGIFKRMALDTINPELEDINKLDDSKMEELAEKIVALLVRELELEAERSSR